MKTAALVLLYLGAIVAANLIVNHYGPSSTPFVAFALIGCDLTARDLLHVRWEGPTLYARIAALIAAGGLITYLLNADAGTIALASVVAFVAAALTDTVVYALLGGADRRDRIDLSNVAAAAVDSVLFIWIAFGFVGTTTFLQFVAKVAGGLVWRYALTSTRGLLARHA